jgi:hypothetical protein
MKGLTKYVVQDVMGKWLFELDRELAVACYRLTNAVKGGICRREDEVVTGECGWLRNDGIHGQCSAARIVRLIK